MDFENETTGKWSCRIIDPGHKGFDSVSNTIQDVVAYIIGDLKFLSMMLGKEYFDSFWCILCKLGLNDWRECSQDHGELWTLDKLIAQAAKI